MWGIAGGFLFGESYHLELIKDASELFKLYLMSSFIEMIAIKLFFSYKIKQLLIPVLIGNLITNGILIGAHILWLQK